MDYTERVLDLHYFHGAVSEYADACNSGNCTDKPVEQLVDTHRRIDQMVDGQTYFSVKREHLDHLELRVHIVDELVAIGTDICDMDDIKRDNLDKRIVVHVAYEHQTDSVNAEHYLVVRYGCRNVPASQVFQEAVVQPYPVIANHIYTIMRI